MRSSPPGPAASIRDLTPCPAASSEEVLAATGLILPAALDIAPVLVPLAAVGVVLLMVGAMITHLRRHESKVIAANLTYLALAGFVALARFVG